MKKILIATPAFGGKVTAYYAHSLAKTVSLLDRLLIPNKVLITNSSSLLVAERNRIIKHFIESDCTHILCIDADIGWPPEAVVALINFDLPFVCGVYPARNDRGFFFRPAANTDGMVVSHEKIKHLLKMESVPAGFMLIEKKVFKSIEEKLPELYYRPKHPEHFNEDGFAYFNVEVSDGEFWGEDYVFCKHARLAGYEIYADPLITFEHDGKIGALCDLMKKEKESAECAKHA